MADGSVTFKGNPLTLSGRTPEAGDAAPAFTARTGLAPDSEWNLGKSAGRVRILSVVPSLDTHVCSIQTRRFSKELENLPGVEMVTVSADLPVAQSRWAGEAEVGNVTFVSDYYDGSFGRAFGVRIRELGLLARSVFVVDGEGVVRYAQVVPEVTDEPDYEPVLAAAREILG